MSKHQKNIIINKVPIGTAPTGGCIINHPATAADFFIEALLARLRKDTDSAAEYERYAQKCSDYTVELHVAHLLAVAKRHTRYSLGDAAALRATLEEAWERAQASYRAQLMYLAGIGAILAWEGHLAEAYVSLFVAQMVLTAMPLIASQALWRSTTDDMGFVLRQLEGQPEEIAKLKGLLA